MNITHQWFKAARSRPDAPGTLHTADDIRANGSHSATASRCKPNLLARHSSSSAVNDLTCVSDFTLATGSAYSTLADVKFERVYSCEIP